MDFAVLPPEINSGRMYAGPGSGSMMTAAVAWDGLAAELRSAATSYSSVISGLTAGWRGPSSSAMAAAAAPYAAWMSSTASQAEQASAQARAAATAYQTAFAAMVPPPVIAANRSQLALLVEGNLLGQNTPAIVATEAQYADMWAQDAAAMYGYADSAALATQLTPFTEPPQTTNPATEGGQGAAVAHAVGSAAGGHAQTLMSTAPQLISAVPQSLQSLASPVSVASPDPPSLVSLLGSLTGPFSPFQLVGPGLTGYLFSSEPTGLVSVGGSVAELSQKVSALPAAGSGELLQGGLGSGTRVVGPAAGVSADIGRASLIGRLSVPQSWASAAPAITPVAMVLPDSSLGAAPVMVAADNEGSSFSNMALSSVAGRAMAGTGDTAARSIRVGGGAYSGHAANVTIFVLPPDE